MSIITNETKGAPITIQDVDASLTYIAQALGDANLVPKDYEPLTGDVWQLESGSNFKKLQLTDDAVLFTEGGRPAGVYVLDVKQPVNGGKTLFIDGFPMLLNPLEVTTIIVAVGGFGKKYISEASATALAPHILTQSEGITTIVDGLVKFFVRGFNIKKVRVYKDGSLVEEKVSPSFQFRMASKLNEGCYQFELESADGQTIWSDEMSAVLAEAEPAKISLQAISANVPAGSTATLKTDAAGTPTSRIDWEKNVNGQWESTGISGKEFTTDVFYTGVFRPVATNRYKVEVEVPATYEADGVTVKTPATTKFEYKTFTDPGNPATLKPIKQSQVAPTVTMDDNTPQSFLSITGGSATEALRYEGSLDVTVDSPVPVPVVYDSVRKVMKLVIGDMFLAAHKAGIRLKETITLDASPWATNDEPFTSALQPALNSLAYYGADTGVSSADGFTWFDQSGNDITLKAEGAAVPVVVPNGLNGRAVLSFDNSPLNSLEAIGIKAATPKMLMVLFKRTQVGAGNVMGIGTGQTGDDPKNVFADIAVYPPGMGYHVNGPLLSNNVDRLDWQVATVIDDGSGNITFYVNDTQVTGNASTENMPDGATLRVGGGHTANIPNFKGLIAEIIISEDISDAARLKNLNYLNTKWGL
ncbi:hypothetical protein [Mucilaginibacter sp. CSA2-8R]|uniref:hypothetical protein n=1 Tax=Mucilaginibacter sp. CSA2-8R TaxID=3141542 RepID=UPI00315D32C2